MKINRLVCLVPLMLVTFTPACGSGSAEVLPSTPLDPHGQSVTILWSIGDADSTCAQVADMTYVSLEIDGEALEGEGHFPCNASGQDGVTLTQFRPGHYSFTLHTSRRGNHAPYYGGGQFDIGLKEVVVHARLYCSNPSSGC